MIKFKNILNEQNELYALYDLLTEKYYSEKPLLIRGTDREISTYKELDIRKNRRPRDTMGYVDAIIDAIEDGHYPNLPKRSESKFAATSDNIDIAQQYGEFVYYCFPHKSASVYSLDKDSLDYFDIYETLGAGFVRDLLDNTEYSKIPNLHNFFAGLLTYLERGDVSKLRRDVYRDWQEIIDEKDRILDHDIDFEDDEAFYYYKDMTVYVRAIEGYFEDIENGVKRDSPEVIFDGPSYVMVNRKYFNENFTYNGSKLALI